MVVGQDDVRQLEYCFEIDVQLLVVPREELPQDVIEVQLEVD